MSQQIDAAITGITDCRRDVTAATGNPSSPWNAFTVRSSVRLVEAYGGDIAAWLRVGGLTAEEQAQARYGQALVALTTGNLAAAMAAGHALKAAGSTGRDYLELLLAEPDVPVRLATSWQKAVQAPTASILE